MMTDPTAQDPTAQDRAAWFAPESTIWVPLPLDFPNDRFETVESWALALSLEWGTSMGADDWAREQFVLVAIGLAGADSPLEDAVARWWFLPEDPNLSAVVHAYALDIEDAAGALREHTEFYATDGYDLPELRRLVPIELAAFEHAVTAVTVVEIPDHGSAIVARAIGAVDDGLYMVEVLDTRPVVSAAVAEQLPDLLGSIRFG